MMMESMIKLPDDIFRQELILYLTVYDIVRLDSACINHKYRPQVLDKISGVILTGDKDEYMKASLYKWLGMRQIYLINMNLDFQRFTPSSIENNYVDQFKYNQHVVMKGSNIRDDIAMFIIYHSPCLLSMDISNNYPGLITTDHTLQSIAEHCTGLQSLSISNCREITDTGLITISEYCPNLKSLRINYCDQITDASIISISTHCTGLQSLLIENCEQITDACIISISTHCTELQSLNLWYCVQISDASIISISTHCTGLQSLDLGGCDQITDASIISISTHCTWLKRLNVSYTRITDASLIAIAKNCTGLQNLRTYQHHGLMSIDGNEYKSVFELRAVLLSIYPSLPI